MEYRNWFKEEGVVHEERCVDDAGKKICFSILSSNHATQLRTKPYKFFKTPWQCLFIDNSIETLDEKLDIVSLLDLLPPNTTI